ncbi:VOC family protein [Paenibacillus sp. MWE-103]|uniref:VOC family protein n=1 Tax=Paenibacillus artemisiicola TaxID=1172618 RepID=A0ABS3W8I5_9BACL|nr:MULTISPECIES: VOC family protein [Paenibacillus]MBO7744597.1 VOC family protein [Paenibacillus artemisiicola]SFJ00420.1 lactoylglutathione lyase [Paenibacillus sp. UNC496MF]
MAVRKLEHVGIMVTDMDKSIRFYTEVVGLKYLYSLTHTNGVILMAFLTGSDGEQTEIELIQNYPGQLAPEGRTHHVAFTVDDVEAEFARLNALEGVTVRDAEITTLPNGARYFFFDGPDGEFLEMFQPASQG